MSISRNQRRAFGRIATNRGGAGIIRAADGRNAVRRLIGGALLAEQSRNPGERPLPLKSDRLRQLFNDGFNVADFRSWLRGELNREELRAFHRMHTSVSLRNFREERENDPSPRLPVHYGLTDGERIEELCGVYNREHHTLVNEYLPLDNSVYAGNIVLLADERYLAVYFEGIGTPRDADDPATSPALHAVLREQAIAMPETVPEPIRDLGERLCAFMPEFRPMTVEFSVYPYSVGLLQTREVVWEWRGGTTYDLFNVLSCLARQSRAFDATIKIVR